MHAFNYDAFLKKATSDVGGMAVNRGGAINLVPGMPGMGLFASIAAAFQAMTEQGGVQAKIAALDEVIDELGLVSRAPKDDLKNCQVVVIDAVGQHLEGQRLEALAKRVSQAQKHASVWVVGGDIDALNQALGGEASRFQVRAKPRRVGGPATKTSGPRP